MNSIENTNPDPVTDCNDGQSHQIAEAWNRKRQMVLYVTGLVK